MQYQFTMDYWFICVTATMSQTFNKVEEMNSQSVIRLSMWPKFHHVIKSICPKSETEQIDWNDTDMWIVASLQLKNSVCAM